MRIGKLRCPNGRVKSRGGGVCGKVLDQETFHTVRYRTIGTDVKGLGPIVGMVDCLHNTVKRPYRLNFDKLWLTLARTG